MTCTAKLNLWESTPIDRRILRMKLHTWYRCPECGAVKVVKGTVPSSIDCGAEIGVQSVEFRDVCNETAYGTTVRLSRSIRVF